VDGHVAVVPVALTNVIFTLYVLRRKEVVIDDE
jgi:hypothetical protein